METRLMPWKTIEIGTFEEVKDLYNYIHKYIDIITTSAKSIIMGRTVLSKEKVELVKIKVYDMNFFKGAYHNNLSAQIVKLGLKFCPNETELKILQEKDIGETVHIPNDRYNFIIRSDRNGNPISLDGFSIEENHFYNSDDYLIFALIK